MSHGFYSLKIKMALNAAYLGELEFRENIVCLITDEVSGVNR